MAWTTDLLLFVRTLIGDLDSSKYTDSRLEQIIAVGAYNVNDASDFDFQSCLFCLSTARESAWFNSVPAA